MPSRRGVPLAQGELPEEPRAARLHLAGGVGGRVEPGFDHPVPNHEEAQAEPAAQAQDTLLALAACPGAESGDGDIDPVRDPLPLHALEEEIEGKGELQLDDHRVRRTGGIGGGGQGDIVTSGDFTLHRVTLRLEERLDRWIEVGLSHCRSFLRDLRSYPAPCASPPLQTPAVAICPGHEGSAGRSHGPGV